MMKGVMAGAAFVARSYTAPMSDYKKNLVSSLIFLVLGITLIIFIPITIPLSEATVIGPRAFPYFIATAMIVLSAVLLISTLLQRGKQGLREEKTEEKEPRYRQDELRALALIGITLLYIFLFDKIGYFLSTFLSSTLVLLLFRVKKVWYYLIVYAVGAGVYFAFTKLLFVTLP